MLKKKFFVKDMELDGKLIGEGFSDESYIIIDIPSVQEKMNLKNKFANAESQSELDNIELLKSFILTINCKPVDEDEVITDFELLTCYAFGTSLMGWLGNMLASGFVPKKV